jgi:hypothetical protein
MKEIPYYSEKQIRKAWKRATKRIEDELYYGEDSTVDVLIRELRDAQRADEREAEKDETFTLSELFKATSAAWDLSYYDGIVAMMRANRGDRIEAERT